ncbi:RDD family protein [Neptuniibacter halophilus]|uniref:RDD family protein n=1 Tax=Neptuniibacter halophilus TaxID=651666 RepID=UPI002572606C|nr:RDD family protein [Neptuniibacter halophilus]
MVDNVYKAPDSELELPANQEARKRPLASRWSRLFASLIDSIVLMLVMVPLMFISGGMAGMMQVGDSLLYSLGMGISGIVIFLLINFNWLKKDGQTLGKKLLGIKIVSLDDQQAQVGDHLLKRYAVYFLPGQIPVLGQLFVLVNLLFIFGSEKRCVHDLAGGTKVVKCD